MIDGMIYCIVRGAMDFFVPDLVTSWLYL